MSHNQYQIVTLDKRHKAHGLFSHYVDFWSPKDWRIGASEQVADFNTRRAWCWENFGPGLEVDYTTWGTDASWAWWRDTQHLNLYLAEASLSAYLLYWS
jgi:hypothetical protein